MKFRQIQLLDSAPAGHVCVQLLRSIVDDLRMKTTSRHIEVAWLASDRLTLVYGARIYKRRLTIHLSTGACPHAELDRFPTDDLDFDTLVADFVGIARRRHGLYISTTDVARMRIGYRKLMQMGDTAFPEGLIDRLDGACVACIFTRAAEYMEATHCRCRRAGCSYYHTRKDAARWRERLLKYVDNYM